MWQQQCSAYLEIFHLRTGRCCTPSSPRRKLLIHLNLDVSIESFKEFRAGTTGMIWVINNLFPGDGRADRISRGAEISPSLLLEHASRCPSLWPTGFGMVLFFQSRFWGSPRVTLFSAPHKDWPPQIVLTGHFFKQSFRPDFLFFLPPFLAARRPGCTPWPPARCVLHGPRWESPAGASLLP